MSPPTDRSAGPAMAEDPWQEIDLLVQDLVVARADLAAATAEADEAGAELRRRTADIGDLNDILEAAMAATDDVVVVVTAANRRVRAWSGGAARRFGLQAHDVAGRALSAVRAPGLPAARLGEEVARMARPAPPEAPVARTVEVEGGTGRFRLTAVPPDPAQPVRAVVVTLRPGPRSDVHPGAEPADDAGQPA